LGIGVVLAMLRLSLRISVSSRTSTPRLPIIRRFGVSTATTSSAEASHTSCRTRAKPSRVLHRVSSRFHTHFLPMRHGRLRICSVCASRGGVVALSTVLIAAEFVIVELCSASLKICFCSRSCNFFVKSTCSPSFHDVNETEHNERKCNERNDRENTGHSALVREETIGLPRTWGASRC